MGTVSAPPLRAAWPGVPTRSCDLTGRSALLPSELGDLVVVGRGVADQSFRQGEDPLRHAQRQREATAAGTEVRLVQPDRVIGLEPHVYQLRSLQHPPAVTLTGQRDRSLLRVGPAAVMVEGLSELAVAVIFPGERH